MTALSRQSRWVATRGTLLQFPNFRKRTLQICGNPGRWTWDDSSSERYAPHKTASLTSQPGATPATATCGPRRVCPKTLLTLVIKLIVNLLTGSLQSAPPDVIVPACTFDL